MRAHCMESFTQGCANSCANMWAFPRAQDEDTDEEADGSGSDASEEEGSEGISGSEGSEDAEGAGEVLATGRHHDKAKYRVSWFFFSGTAVDVGNALGVAARHIDGNCAAHVDELMRQFEMPMPASDGWVRI